MFRTNRNVMRGQSTNWLEDVFMSRFRTVTLSVFGGMLLTGLVSTASAASTEQGVVAAVEVLGAEANLSKTLKVVRKGKVVPVSGSAAYLKPGDKLYLRNGKQAVVRMFHRPKSILVSHPGSTYISSFMYTT